MKWRLNDVGFFATRHQTSPLYSVYYKYLLTDISFIQSMISEKKHLYCICSLKLISTFLGMIYTLKVLIDT